MFGIVLVLFSYSLEVKVKNNLNTIFKLFDEEKCMEEELELTMNKVTMGRM